MTLTIELDPTTGERLQAAAKREGTSPETIAHQLLTRQLAAAHPVIDPTLALFSRWDADDLRRTDEEVASENDVWEKFQANVNETRAELGMRRL